MSGTNAPFDPLAADYDRTFSDRATGRWLRDRTHQWLTPLFAPGTRVLELGCGTGEDALWLARRGVRVLATDASAAMLEQTRTKAQNEPLVSTALLDLNELPSSIAGSFDGVIANFGALNCVTDRPRLARWLAERMRPGARAAFAIMGPVCLWEIGWHGLHGELRTAARRLHGSTSFQPPGSNTALRVDYPSAGTVAWEFAPFFRIRATRGLGLFLPPSDLFGMVEKQPRLSTLLTGLEQRWSGNRVAALLSDHYWIELVRI